MAARFTLRVGDKVEFIDRDGKTRTGTLVIRPYGRRLYGAVRANGQVHHVPTRTRITAKVK